MSEHIDEIYKRLLEDILDNGELIQNGRTAEAYYSVFGRQYRVSLRDGFPLLTTKRVPFRLIASELLWFLSGSSNVKDLQAQNNHIWDEWATKEQCAKFGREEGDLGPIYGPLWRKWEAIDSSPSRATEFDVRTPEDVEEIDVILSKLGVQHGLIQNGEASSITMDKYDSIINSAPYSAPLGPMDPKKVVAEIPPKRSKIDQIARVIERIKTNPSCRRLIVTGWNPATCDQVSLPPCHTLFQFRVSHGGTRLNCQLYQRSADAFLGVPFNIASYALLTHMIAQVTGLEVGEFVHTFGDLHVYETHLEQVKEQLTRAPLPLPQLWLDPSIKNIDDFRLEHVKLNDYQSHAAIKGAVAV